MIRVTWRRELTLAVGLLGLAVILGSFVPLVPGADVLSGKPYRAS